MQSAATTATTTAATVAASTTVQQPPRPRFSAAHDNYSFGVVLVELGLRESVMAIYNRAKKSPGYTHSASEFRKWLLTHEVPKLNGVAPQGYCEVARRCLEGDFQIEQDETLEQAYYRQGVHVLRRGLDLNGV